MSTRTAPARSATPLLVCRLDRQRFAFAVPVVERLVRSAEVTPLPNAPAIVLGVVNVHGRALPVLDLRTRFQLPTRVIQASDWFVIARTRRRSVVLPVDESEGLIEPASGAVVESAEISPGVAQFPGVLMLDDGIVLIHDLETFLSFDEADALDAAMADGPQG